MLRVTFGGEQLAGFPPDHETANIKLLLPNTGQSWQDYLAALRGVGDKPLKRTYTVLEYRAANNELDVDFALHPKPGPSTQWALDASVGDSIAIAGPGAPKKVAVDASWYLLAGDMSALPAISANLRGLSAEARGHVIITVPTTDDQQPLPLPANMQIRWIVHTDPSDGVQPLLDAVKQLEPDSERCYFWVAGESNSVREIRRYLVQQKNIPSVQRYTSGYWQLGHTEDTHQLIKRREPKD